MKKVVKIGVDFGDSFSFSAFIHGESVMPLIPGKEYYGIPSVFYHGDGREYVGRLAEQYARRAPRNVVYSVKRNLDQPYIEAGGKQFTPSEIVTKIITYVLQCAEERLMSEYPDVEYDEMEVAVSVPVSFEYSKVRLIRKAAEAAVLKSGKKIYITGVIQEPCAAALEYFSKTKQTDADIIVYDLGGGTFDAALVSAVEAGEAPYEVIDQIGISDLGGDDWDAALCDLVAAKYEEETGKKMPDRLKKENMRKIRDAKHELTDYESTSVDIMERGSEYEFEITREEFERATRPLLDRTLAAVSELLKRQQNRNVKYLIMTGGSSYMPQVKNALENSGILPGTVEIKFYNPEHAIAYGAARYAAALEWQEDAGEAKVKQPSPIILRAPHSYGLTYYVPALGGKPMIRLFIKKGDKLPVTAKEQSRKKEDAGAVSEYKLFETDVFEGDKITAYRGRELLELSEGHEIASVLLERENVPKGAISTQRVTLDEKMELKIEAYDEARNVRTQQRVKIDMTGA